MQINTETWKNDYYRETNRANRKRILDLAVMTEGPTKEVELCQKLYDARYGNSRENKEVDYFIRGLMTLEYMKISKGIWNYKKKRDRERESVLKDFQWNLVKSYGETGEQIIYKEYCNLIKLYLELCERDRTYSSLIFGLGKIKRESFKKKVAEDIYRIAYIVPKKLNLEKELFLFSKAAAETFYRLYPGEADSFYQRIANFHL